MVSWILLHCPNICTKKIQLISTCYRKTAMLLVLTRNILKQLQKGDLLILLQKCSPSSWGCSQELSIAVAKTNLIPFFSPQTNAIKQGLSETYYSLSLRHLEPGLPQTLCYSEEKWKRQTALQNKSIAFIIFFYWCFWEGRNGREKKGWGFQHWRSYFLCYLKLLLVLVQINGIVHFPVICLR